MDPLTLLFVGLQIGVSLYNQARNGELTARIKEEQRKAKLDEIKNNQRRDMERFQRLCQLQEEMETAAHVRRIEKIQQDFLNTFETMAHKDNLDSHYPLNVSPYVIQRSIIPLTASDLQNIRQDLFCILTASNDMAFNKNVLPYLDEAICDVISKHWNESSNHTLCYYQNLWNHESNQLFSNEDVESIKSLIKTPTISFTPWFSQKGDRHYLIFKISAWGLGNEDSLYCEIETGISFDTLSTKYSIQEISKLVERILPYVVCPIGQIADVYYWVTSYLPPQLPYLLGNCYIKVSDKLRDEYAQVYSKFYTHLVLGVPDKGENYDKTLADVAEINLYTYPERSLACLNSIIALTDKSSLTPEMIKSSILSFYRAKTEGIVDDVNQLDASLLKSLDVGYVLTLIDYAKSTENALLAKDLSEIVKRYVSSWRYPIS